LTMSDCKSNYTYENWAHTLKFKPERFCEPDAETKVIEIVKNALAQRRPGAHSRRRALMVAVRCYRRHVGSSRPPQQRPHRRRPQSSLYGTSRNQVEGFDP